jgi:ABC-type lipoprotein export system ATPase subunit
MTALVTVRNVHKVYRRGSERIDVLHGVNLDIPAGDFLALMGPSGSGKTTLLLCVLNRDHGKTIVMVTHDPRAAAAARRVLHLDKGRLVGEAAA